MKRTQPGSKRIALDFCKDAFDKLLTRRERADVEWALCALHLDSLTGPQLQAIEWLVDNVGSNRSD